MRQNQEIMTIALLLHFSYFCLQKQRERKDEDFNSKLDFIATS